MRRQLPDANLAQTIAWLWLGILVVGVVAWFAYRYWRSHHPHPTSAPERSYSQRLEERLAKRQVATKRKRRGGPAKRDPRRH